MLLPTLADGNSAHDQYFFLSPEEMIRGVVQPPDIFTGRSPRRQLFAFCSNNWFALGLDEASFRKKQKAWTQ